MCVSGGCRLVRALAACFSLRFISDISYVIEKWSTVGVGADADSFTKVDSVYYHKSISLLC